MNRTLSDPGQTVLSSTPGGPVQRLTVSRLQMAQALRQSVGLLLLQRLLGPVGPPCHQTPKAASSATPHTVGSSDGTCTQSAQTTAPSHATHQAPVQPPGTPEPKTPP